MYCVYIGLSLILISTHSASIAAESDANYDSSGLLFIKDISVNGQRLQANLQNQGGFKFKLQSLGISTAALAKPALYDADLGTVKLSRVSFDGFDYSVCLQQTEYDVFQLDFDSVFQLATVGEAYKPLSAGRTLEPNTNYSVTETCAPDYEPPHNTRVEEPYKELIPKLSPNVPVQLRPHSRLLLTDIEDRTFFDYFAWQTFVGLVWPVDPELRGVANQKVTAENFSTFNSVNGGNPNRVPVVWESFRTFDAVFPGDAITQPQAWDAVAYNRPFDLDLTTKGQSPTSLNEAFSRPLIDQNRQYVRYNLQLNEVMYEFIRQNKWYLKENLPKAPTQATLPPLPVEEGDDRTIISDQQPQTNTIVKQPVNGNSIELKSAWRIMITEKDPAYPWREVDDLSRYFVSRANVSDPVTGEVKKNQLVGLVGLHVVVKTPQFTQGIWSSFEHVDNVKAPAGIRPSFNGTGSKFSQGFSYKPERIDSENPGYPEDSPMREPVEVSRIYKIPTTPVGTAPNLPDGLSTVGLNKTYQRLFAGTVWQYYQLVITQWPTDPTSFYPKPFLYPRGDKPDKDQPKAVQDAYARAEQNALNSYPRWAGLPIPQTGALNTTMETYFQNPNDDQSLEHTSCMGCHYGASDMDFSWGVKLRTFPQPFNQGRINPDEESPETLKGRRAVVLLPDAIDALLAEKEHNDMLKGWFFDNQRNAQE